MDQQYQYQIKHSTASDFRARARQALKGFFGYAILAFLIASLLGGAATGASGGFSFSFGGSDLPFGDPDAIGPSIDADMEYITNEIAHLFDILIEEGIRGIYHAYPIMLVISVIVCAVFLFAILFSLLVSAPVAVGYRKYNLNLIDGRDQQNLGTLFTYFKNGYGKTVLARVIYGLINFVCSLPLMVTTVVLGIFNAPILFDILQGDYAKAFMLALSALLLVAVSLLTAVLQIVVTYRYHYAYMILAEYPQMRVTDAFRNSAHLMRGNKWRLFCLQLSFIGWALLAGCCTCGIGNIFLQPYINAADAAFYDEIANRRAARETEFPSLDPNDYIQ